MDLTDINKVGSTKRMKIEAENIQEKVSHVKAKIIKLKVAQDTAYWDLKEKLQQVEGNHEKLQQNMVEVQMQHEAISGQYQEELRLRPDTLNKVSSTRQMCAVLQEYIERLRSTLSACAADQAALSEAYQRSGQLVRELRAQHAADAEGSRAHAAALQDKVQLLTDHGNQMAQFFSNMKQQADEQVEAMRGELAAATAHADELRAVQSQLSIQLEQYKLNLERKEEMNASLHAEMKRLIQELNSETTQSAAIVAARENEIKGLKEENMSLKKAVENQDQFTKSICEQNNVLQEKIAALEDEHVMLVKNINELTMKVQEAASANVNLQNNIISLNEEKQGLLQQVLDTAQNLDSLKAETKTLQAEYTKLKNEKSEVILELERAVQEFNNKTLDVERLTALKAELDTTLAEREAESKLQREASDEKIKELKALIEAKDNELDSKAGTINELMSQLKMGSEISSKLEGALQKIKKDIEIERDSSKEKEREMTSCIAKLETTVRNKDDELSKQMSIMLETRNEKERLQEKIQSMQQTIDNIQKELTPAPARPVAPHLQPELDDNAVMLTMSHETQLAKPPSPVLSCPPSTQQFAVPRAHDADSMLFSLFSDSSMEGDSLDSAEVNRRFNALARGERLPPTPLSALKRRRGTAPAPGGLRHKPSTQATDNNTDISLSEIKNNMKNKERIFFKNKRFENKPKGLK